jgi:hypothetical protein
MHTHEYRTHHLELVSLPRLPLGEDKWREAQSEGCAISEWSLNIVIHFSR